MTNIKANPRWQLHLQPTLETEGEAHIFPPWWYSLDEYETQRWEKDVDIIWYDINLVFIA